MRFFAGYLKQHRKGIAIFFLFCIVFFTAFALYHLPVAAVVYPAAVCFVLGVVFLSSDCVREYRKYRELLAIQKLSTELMTEDDFPAPASAGEAEYQQIVRRLRQEQEKLRNSMDRSYSDMMDYYTAWVHQIKTPMASMRLNLQNEDSEFSRRLAEDLFRIEQYVDMVLCYLRLDSDSTDYVIKEYNLDDIVRNAVRRFGPQFYRKKIRLVYEPLNTAVITDEKWLAFVIEQVISNSLKYTPAGTVTIEMEGRKTLCIRDTGIGIAPEDVPRIFEKGFTGCNGRSDKKASGIGLYLCRRICENLGHRITAESSPGSGTAVRIRLEHEKLEIE